MAQHNHNDDPGNDTGDDSLLKFQLDLIKIEINHLQEIIGRIDTLTQQIKNWTIVVWAGSISIIIGNPESDIRRLIIFSAVIPLLFWMVDGHFRRRQRSFIFRMENISHYLNSQQLKEAFRHKYIKDFILLDLTGKQTSKKHRDDFANLGRTMWFRSLRTFYLGIIIVSLILEIILYPVSR